MIKTPWNCRGDEIFVHTVPCVMALVQGRITTHEWQSKNATREWLWTLITRCVDFRNASFFLNPDFDDEMEVNMWKWYVQSKVEGYYKVQDRKKVRETESEECVDVEWMMDGMNSNCQRCSKRFNFTIKNGSLCSDFTAQRLENSIGHFRSNCTILCKQCNSISRCFF